jgi:hypothetical protein
MICPRKGSSPSAERLEFVAMPVSVKHGSTESLPYEKNWLSDGLQARCYQYTHCGIFHPWRVFCVSFVIGPMCAHVCPGAELLYSALEALPICKVSKVSLSGVFSIL